MARNQHSFAKRQRELEKKEKKELKRQRKLDKQAESIKGEDDSENISDVSIDIEADDSIE